MDLTGPYPKLTDADSVYAIKEYSEQMAAKVAAAVAKLPQGVVAKALPTTSTSGLTAQTVVANVKNVSFVAGRAYLIKWNTNFYVDSVSDTFAFGLARANNGDSDTSIANMTEIKSLTDRASASGEGRNKILEAYFFPTAAQAGVQQVKAWVQRVVGNNGNIYITANASNPNQLIIEDKGLVA